MGLTCSPNPFTPLFILRLSPGLLRCRAASRRLLDVVVPRKLKRKRLRAPIGHEPKIDGVGLVEMVAQHRAARDVEVLRSRLSQRRVPEEEDPDDETGIGGRT